MYRLEVLDCVTVFAEVDVGVYDDDSVYHMGVAKQGGAS